MPKILIVEDNVQFQDVLKETLVRAGYTVLLADNGKIGCDMYRAQKPDLVITDVIMPEKDGPELIFELQKDFPDIKMIVISGGGHISGKEYLDSVKRYSKIKHAFEKPFAMSDLLGAVKELIGE